MNFDEFIEYLSDELNIDLVIDQENSVSLEIDNHLKVQIEMDPYTKEFLFLSYIYELSAGKFREDIFLSALKANGFPTMIGAFSYFKDENYLTFHKFVSSDTPKEEIVDILTEIIYIAENWKKALDNGRSAPDNMSSITKNEPPNPFGLRP